MKEAKERGSGAVKRDWEPRLMEARYLGQHARTGVMTGITADGNFMEDLDVDHPKQSVGISQVGRISKECRGIFDRRACQCRRSMLRLSQSQPRQSEENEGGRDPGKEQSHSDRETKCPRGGVQEERAAAAPTSASDAAETKPSARRTRGGDIRATEFYFVRKDVDKFGPTPRCPGCADVSKGVSVKHAHNDECRNRIAKLLIDEGAQRVESYFDRTRVRDETSTGEALLSSGSATVVTDAQTVETDERSKEEEHSS